FAILSAGQPVMGTFAHATHFVMLFAVAGLLMLLAGLEKKRERLIFGAGAMLGPALLMKQRALFISFFCFSYLCWEGYQGREAVRKVSLRVALFSGGLVTPFGLTALLLLRAGVFGKFWFWTFTYASSYVTQVALGNGIQSFFGKFGRIVSASPLLWI